MFVISRLGLRRGVGFVVVSWGLLLATSCGKPAAPTAAPTAASEPDKHQTAARSPVSSEYEPPAPSAGTPLPLGFGRSTADLDQMVKRQNIRALVVMNPIGFFYDKGHPMGGIYEALEALQDFVNQKLKTGKAKVTVTFIPVRIDQLEAALIQGIGDIIATGIVVTPDREKRVAFSTPIFTNVTQII